MRDFVTKVECNKSHFNLMEEFNKFKQEIKVELAGLPEKLIEKMDKKYVSQEAFAPIRKVVYGLIGAILMAFVAAILALILK